MFVLAFAIFITAIFGIAVSSIATQCYNSDQPGTTLKAQMPGNFNFTIVNMVCNIIMLLLGIFCMYIGATSS